MPQGSLLGPLFFNIFINDITFFCDNSSLRLYADDTTLYSSDPSPNILEIKINQDLASINDWLSINYLSINTSKTKAITFGNSDFTPSFKIKNKIIEQKECLDLLGVTIDSSLTMNVHIKNTLNKVYAKLSAIRRIKNLISINTATKLYKAFILPHFEYCSPLLLGVTNGLRDKLEKANCFGLRSVLKLPHDCSYDDALHLGKLQSLERRRSCYSLSLVHQALASTRGPNYIKELFQIQQSRYNLRGGPLGLAQPTSNSKWTHRSFTYLVIWLIIHIEIK